MTVGSTDALSKVFQMIDTDAVIFDQFAYGTACATARTMGKHLIGVPGDENGMSAEALRSKVLDYRKRHNNNKTARLLYLVPVAQNPTGFSISIERKREILQVCRELDIIVIEDGKTSQSR